jgi:hypothetical protein
MTYYVYSAVKGKRWPENWSLLSKHPDYEDARKVAIKLAGRGDLYTEPGHGLKEAFFTTTAKWKAMIHIKDIHEATS